MSVRSLYNTHQEMGFFARTIAENKNYCWLKPSGQRETWGEVARRVAWSVCSPYVEKCLVEKIEKLIAQRKFMPGGRYLYAAGRQKKAINNCFLLRCYDTKEGWADLTRRAMLCLMWGGGIGADYSDVRGEGDLVKGLGGFSTGPLSPMQIVNEAGRHIKQGGSRRAAIWARLAWDHKDIDKFISIKDWPEWLVEQKSKDFHTPAPMDCTNISTGLNGEFFRRMNAAIQGGWTDSQVEGVYWNTVEHMVRTAEPGFSIDTDEDEGEILRNACTEVSSRDDNDVCNLGSLVLSRFSSIEEFEEGVFLGTLFLICGSLYGDLPYSEVYAIREKNRRLGLGLMGFHEWLLRREKRYGEDPELAQWLSVYARSTDVAREWCEKLSISPSVKTRALAPNGTIGIVAETTTCMEPIFAVSLLRRYLSGNSWKAQYIIDATAQRLIDDGVDPYSIEDAYSLSEDVERRVAFQAWVQQYVDHGISSTINLPQWGSSVNNEDTVKPFGRMLLKYLPKLRGITCYPDGARGGQPLTKVPYSEAVKHLNKEFDSNNERETVVEEYGNEQGCKDGVCGI